ncbi:MAG TPA: HEAT repeat domain-containing protein [Pyrinomonadaceae bacterium]|nr:HEAT repeat domain-containing protein [Pyrinomonadaceae bacterium]
MRRGLSALPLLALAAVGLVFLQAPARTARGFDQDLDRLNRFVQRGDSPGAQTFRQGRDLIEKEDWAGAAARFEGYVSQHPKSQDADAALYWLAYALKKQRKFQAAEKALERLVGEFPRSTWADDARAMQVEIAPQVGKRVDPEGLDDELKLVALQSLFHSDPARAAALAAELLKPGSRASRELKETAVSLLGQHGGPEAAGMLLDIARTQPDPDLRAIAVHRLGQTNDERVFDELVKIYESERDREVKGQVLHAFAQMNSPRAHAKLLEFARVGDLELRVQAIHWLGQRRGEAVIDELLSIFRAERGEEVRGAVLHALSQMSSPRARSALLGIARDGGDPEARRQAIHWLGQLDDAASVEELVRLYDAERDEDVKVSLLHAFSRSKQERALLKLMDVARVDASREMRKQAIHWLGQSRDPRALKFIQDLLR